MTDIINHTKRSEIMSKIKSTNTQPELKIRKGLHRLGFRFRLHDKSLPGTPDIVLKKYNTVIQVRGCFWHSHGCKLSKKPKSNIDYWHPKLDKNKKRDKLNDFLLNSLGWSVIIVWECKIKNKSGLETEIKRIKKLILKNKLKTNRLF